MIRVRPARHRAPVSYWLIRARWELDNLRIQLCRRMAPIWLHARWWVHIGANPTPAMRFDSDRTLADRAAFRRLILTGLPGIIQRIEPTR